MAAWKIVALPQNFTVCRIETGCPVAAKMHINPTTFAHRRRRGVSVHRIAEWLGLVAVEELLRMLDLPRIGIDTENVEVMSIGRRGRQPDLFVEHDGRRPPAV